MLSEAREQLLYTTPQVSGRLPLLLNRLYKVEAIGRGSKPPPEAPNLLQLVGDPGVHGKKVVFV